MTALPPSPHMMKINRRDALVGTLAVGLSAASLALQPRSAFPKLSQEQIEAAIPRQVGPYRYASSDGLIQPPADELSSKLYDQVLARVYRAADSLPIMALFAYGSVQNLTLELHRPEKCYPEQGFSLSYPVPETIQIGQRNIDATSISASRDQYHEQILYWTRIGRDFPQNSWSERMVVMKSNLSGWVPDGMLVRLSVPTLDRQAGRENIHNFVGELVASLPEIGRRLMFG